LRLPESKPNSFIKQNLRHEAVTAAIAAHIVLQIGKRIPYGDRRRARQNSARGWMSSQKAGIVEYTTQATHPTVRNSQSIGRLLQVNSQLVLKQL